MKNKNLTKEYCHDVAKSCTSREHFKQADIQAYRLASRAGWLTKWFPIHRTLTKDDCAKFAKTCSSRSDLSAKDPAIYQKCRRNGWLDEFFPSQARILTYEFCKDVASRYNSRSELDKADHSVAVKCREMGWLSEFFPTRKKAGRDLSYETCKMLASACNSLKEFRDKDPSAYGKALAMGWLDGFALTRVVHGPYTYEECKNIAANCSTRAEFKRTCTPAYRTAVSNGWIDDFEHFVDSRTARSEAMKKYSDADIVATARKYHTLSEFRKNNPPAYQIAHRRNLIRSFTWFDKPVPKNSDCIYVYEFPDLKYAYIGRTVYPTRRDSEHRKPGSSVYEFAKKHNITIPTPKYIKTGLNPYTEGATAEQDTIKQYESTGWTLINKSKGGELGSLVSMKYSKKKCMVTAQKYVYKIDFLRNDPSIYRFAKAHGYLDSYKWLMSTITPASHWTYENCATEASKYCSRREFLACNQSAYNAAKKNKWLDKFFPNK